jgi:hypothetical protein
MGLGCMPSASAGKATLRRRVRCVRSGGLRILLVQREARFLRWNPWRFLKRFPLRRKKVLRGGSGGQGDPVTGGGNASTGADLPIESAPQAIFCDGERGETLETSGVSDPAPSLQSSEKPNPKREQKARIYGSCINHRLVRIQLVENEEMAVMYKIRKNYGRNDIVNVELVDGTPGVNAIYREIWRPV